MPETQNFSNHAKFVPAFHFVILPIFLINVIWSIRGIIAAPSVGSVIALLVAVALLMLAFCARIFALTVQDRVIRLEMRLRLRELLPADIHPRILEFTPGQLVALRFAGDAELPGLARKVLDEKLTDRRSVECESLPWRPFGADATRCVMLLYKEQDQPQQDDAESVAAQDDQCPGPSMIRPHGRPS